MLLCISLPGGGSSVNLDPVLYQRVNVEGTQIFSKRLGKQVFGD